MAYYATARIFADPFGSFLEGQRAAWADMRAQQELLRRMYETYLNERRVDLGYAELGYKYDALESLDKYRQETLDLRKSEQESLDKYREANLALRKSAQESVEEYRKLALEALNNYRKAVLDQRKSSQAAAEAYRKAALDALNAYRNETLRLRKQSEEFNQRYKTKLLDLKEKELNQPSAMENLLKALERLEQQKQQQSIPGVGIKPQSSLPAPPVPSAQGEQKRVSEAPAALPIPKRQDRIIASPAAPPPPVAPQTAQAPLTGNAQPAPSQTAIGGFTLSQRAAQQMQAAPPTTPVPNPLAANLQEQRAPAASKYIYDRIPPAAPATNLPEPLPPPGPERFGQAPLTKPPGSRKYIHDRIPTKLAQPATPSAPGKLQVPMDRLLALRAELVKKLQDPSLSIQAQTELANALARVDMQLREASNAR